MTWFLFISIFLVAFGFGLAFGLFGKLAELINDDCRRLKKCEYKPLDDVNCMFLTSCGEQFCNGKDDGDKVTSWLGFCPFCGGKAKQIRNDKEGE